MRVVVTGGAGFIGSELVRNLILTTDATVCVVDKLTYAGDLARLGAVLGSERLSVEKCDVNDRDRLIEVFAEVRPTAVFHLAAETHVDRSIGEPWDFVHSNVNGTYTMLEVCQRYLRSLPGQRQKQFRFIHVSTDEVFGSARTGYFDEPSPYRPASPYSATKAASDHLVKAWHATYGFPGIVTNCTNNFGPWQHGEKFIPTVIRNAMSMTPIPIYGTGDNIRDWIHVSDHVSALKTVLQKGEIGESYLIGSRNEWSNQKLAVAICDVLDRLYPAGSNRRDLLTPTQDRPGHDFRYAVNNSKLLSLGWCPSGSFKEHLEQTLSWYTSRL